MSESNVPDRLRLAAEACRNIQKQATGNVSWFDWVPKELDRLAALEEASRG